jgi:hypothetical protein
MTPKEKAEELYQKFLRYAPAEEEFEHEHTKQSTLIAVDEIINNNTKIPGVLPQDTMYNTSFWEEVKQEIEKL